MTEPTGGALDFFSSPRQVLLIALKNLGEATTEQLARETYVSPGAVRTHLLALAAQGLVTYDRIRNGPGRPRHMFRLTGAGESIFPQRYADLANMLFAAIGEEDEGAMARVVDRLVDAQVSLASERVWAKDHDERLQQLIALIERYGFFPRLDAGEGGSARVTLRHCPLLRVATAHREVCEIECRAMRTVLEGATVERTEYRLDGDAVCTYSVDWGDPA